MGTRTNRTKASRWLRVGVVSALAAAMTLTGGPAQAGSTTISDPGGVDYYVGNSAADLREVSLAASSTITASWTINGPIPVAGSTSWSGGASYGYKVLFQNRDKQTGFDNAVGGCHTPGGVRVPDAHGSWVDGYHFFVGFDVMWNGLTWTYRATVGEYDPSPGGGFVATELGTSSSPGVWTSSDPSMSYGSHWSVSMSTAATISVSVAGVVSASNPGCSGGAYRTAYVTSGDRIVNVKGLSSFGDGGIALPVWSPVPVPDTPSVTLPVTGADRTVCAVANELGVECLGSTTNATLGGITYISDVTEGNSTEGAYGTNAPNISWTPGVLSAVDTLGPGPRCAWPTFGGLLPTNPLSAPESRCHVDDDAISRGSYFAEWWDTPYGFIAS